MRAPGQTVEEARAQMNNYIEHKLQEYKTLMQQGRRREALIALGEGMHPLMDSTSPSHEGFQVWHSPLSSPRFFSWHAYEHSTRETVDVFNSNPGFMKRSVDLIRRFYDRATK